MWITPSYHVVLFSFFLYVSSCEATLRPKHTALILITVACESALACEVSKLDAILDVTSWDTEMLGDRLFKSMVIPPGVS